MYLGSKAGASHRIERNIKGAGWVNQVNCTFIPVSKGDNVIQLRHSDGLNLANASRNVVLLFWLYNEDWSNCGNNSANSELRIAPTGGVQFNFDRNVDPVCPR